LESAGTIEQPEDLAAIARVRAQAQLALGDATAARATLAGFDGAPTAEVWALMLALRLQAGIVLGQVESTDLERAGDELRSNRLPQLEALVLAAVAADAHQAVKRTDAAAALRERVRSTRDALATTLAPSREHQQRFLGCFPPRA